MSLKLEMNPHYPGLIKNLASHGASSKDYKESMSLDEMVTLILRPIDLLERNSQHQSGLKKNLSVVEQGKMVARSGFNNVDSTRTSVVDQVIQMINFARKNIYIQDQFLFDRKVVDAMILAKRKNPNLDIRILLGPLDEAKPAGFPNTVYLDQMQDAGIQVKKKITINDLPGIAQEFHHKTISADGKYLIVGSANKDQTTMYGSFREEQLDIANSELTGNHDKVFLQRWNSEKESTDFVAFEVPFDTQKFLGKQMEQKDFMELIRSLVVILFEVRES